MPPIGDPTVTKSKRKKRVKKPQVPHGPGGQMLRPAPKQKAPAPTKRQISQAQTQARTYKSQGQQVEKTATRKIKRQKVRQHQVKDTKSDADRGRAKKTYRSDGGKIIWRDMAGDREKASAERAVRLAPVLKVLDQTTRPLHAVAAAAREDIKDVKAGRLPVGHGSLRAAEQGIQNKDRSTFSDVAGDLGVKNKALKAGLGFAGDVIFDPLTHGRGGTASAAMVASKSAARKAEHVAAKTPAVKASGQAASAQAVKRGATPKVAKQAAKTAEKKAVRRAGQKAGETAAKGKQTNRGLNVAFAGHDVPGLARGTATATRAVRKVAPKTQQKVRDTARNVVSDFNPAIAPAGVDRELYQSARRSARTARAGAQRGTQKAGDRAIAYRDAIGKKNYSTVIDAIETGTVKELPKELRGHARELEQEFARMRKAERRAGIKTPKRENYVPHVRLKDDLPKDQVRKGGRNPQAGYTKQRLEGTLAEKNAAKPGAYSEDVADIVLNRGAKSAVDIAKAKSNRALREAGRKPERDVKLKDQIGADEALYKIDGARITKVDPADVTKVTNEHVILNEKLIARTRGTVGVAAERSTSGVIFDRAQGVWKLAATQVNPGYHVRNFAGEAQNAYLKENPIILGRNAVQAAKALRQLGRNEDADRVLGKVAKGAGSERDKFIREAESVGAVRAGQVGREIKDMLQGQSKKSGALKSRRRGITRKPARALKNVEDVFRLATYKGGRDRGLPPEKAMARAAENHFDYGDLTPLERKALRRVMPFYTFSARDIPLQVKTVIQNPGKYAQYQKIREEVAKAFGINQAQAEKDSPEREQRAAPVYVKIGGKTYGISMGPSGLPLTDLNEFPVSKNPVKQADEWMQRAMSLVTPAAKTPVELWANMSFFFRDQIEREEGPLAPAPEWVKHIPAKYRKDLGIVNRLADTRTGKPRWGAPAKVVYALGVLPGPINFANRVQTPSERAGQDTKSKVISYVGLRSTQVDPGSNKIEQMYEQRMKVNKKKNALHQQLHPDNDRKISADNPTPEYTKLLKEVGDLTGHIFALKTKRGDKDFSPGPKSGSGTARISRPSSGSGGGFFKSHERESTTSGTPGQGFFK